MSIVHVTHSARRSPAPRTLPPEFVRRPRLVQRLRSVPEGVLGVIVAPPGYGKSSLIAEWADADDRPFVLIGADFAADKPTSLDTGEPCVVVIEDAHGIPPDALSEGLEAIRRRTAAGSTIAIVTRSEPRLPLGRLRAHRALIEIRTPELAMTPPEAGALLKRAGLQLDFATVQTLVRRTEGWPVALYLAALAVAEQPDPPDSVAAFRGDNHLLVEYIRDEILGHMSRASLVFLRRASILEELSGDVCNAVLDDQQAALRLAKLALTTPLLEPVDPARERYRCHPLFRESLNAELRQREPDLIPTLHARASSWYGEHGRLDDAIEHAVAAGDARRTGTLLWGGLLSFLTPGGIDRTAAWLDRLDADAVARSPQLAMSAACTALAAGRTKTALGYAHDLISRHEETTIDQTLLTGAELIAAITGASEMTAVRDAACRLGEELATNNPWRAACTWFEGMAVYLSGEDRPRSGQLFDEAARFGGQTFSALTASALGARAMLAMEDDDWQLAADLADEADAIITSTPCELPITALALAVVAAVHAHEGRAAEAKQDLHRAAAALANVDESLAWYGAQTRLVLAHASLHLADVVGARTLLAHASRQARRAGNPPAFSSWFSNAWSYLDTIAEASLAGPSALTIAELRVLRFLPSCRPFREIADQLGVSANTVKTQAHAVYRKLGAGSRSEAVLLAREAGLLGE
jgi:LuxR family transcriptional regulator, maltose regulon positive regulatory protein